MDIVSSAQETLDVFIEKNHANEKEAVTKALENYDNVGKIIGNNEFTLSKYTK